MVLYATNFKLFILQFSGSVTQKYIGYFFFNVYGQLNKLVLLFTSRQYTFPKIPEYFMSENCSITNNQEIISKHHKKLTNYPDKLHFSYKTSRRRRNCLRNLLTI